MTSNVVVIATDLRRATIKVTGSTYLVDVLHQACQKLHLDSDKFIFKYKQKQIDLSVPFRTSGLLPGAKLELVQKANTPSVVQIALQSTITEPRDELGGRLIRSFPSDMPLWQILRQFEKSEADKGHNINITARGLVEEKTSGSGQLLYKMPVLQIMGRELSGLVDLQKTLSQLGHNSGNVLVRLSYRKTDQTLLEALESMKEFFKHEEGEDRVPMASESKADASCVGLDPPSNAVTNNSLPHAPSDPDTSTQSPSKDTATDINNANSALADSASKAEATAVSDPYEPVNVFLAPSGTTPAASLAPADEADFTPSIAHAQLHQARLLENSRNKRLPFDKELADKAAAEEARIAAIKSILVRVRFPDNTSSEWEIGPNETGAFLYEAVRHIMADCTLPFHLTLSGRPVVIRDSNETHNTLIRAYKLSGRVLVNFIWDDCVPPATCKMPFLNAAIEKTGQAVKVPDVPTVEESRAPSPLMPAPHVEQSSGSGGQSGAKKTPKWFKLGKK